MQQSVYIVWGLGFGDDEDRWELCSVHATAEGAAAERQRLLDSGVAADLVRAEPYALLA